MKSPPYFPSRVYDKKEECVILGFVDLAISSSFMCDVCVISVLKQSAAGNEHYDERYEWWWMIKQDCFVSHNTSFCYLFI